MTAPISGFGLLHRPAVPQRLRLDIAGDAGLAGLQQSRNARSLTDTLERALGEASAARETAQTCIERFVRGEPVELRQVMAASEEANISLQLLVEFRNALAEAYKTVMNMG